MIRAEDVDGAGADGAHRAGGEGDLAQAASSLFYCLIPELSCGEPGTKTPLFLWERKEGGMDVCEGERLLVRNT